MSFHVSNDVGANMVEVLRLRGDGLVGIGTASPSRPLTIRGTGTNSELISWENNVGDTTWHLNMKNGGLNFGETGVSGGRLFLQPGGGVGIGTSNITRGKLEIVGGILNNLTYAYLNGSNQTGIATDNYLYSIYATQRIAALELHAHSDRRIKQIEGISPGEEDLQTLMQIEITDYRLKDSIATGNKPIKKVIAQQVAEVYPQAISNDLTEVVPDIYQRAEVKEGWIMLATDLKVGERVKLISAESNQVHEVTAVETNRFQVSQLSTSTLSEVEGPNSELSTLFVFGREVDDFHTVDYEAISMLNVSATQEQQRIIDQQQQMIEQLLKEKASQRIELSSQKQEIAKIRSAFEARLQALEALLSQAK